MKEALLQINYRCNANCVFCEVPDYFKDKSREPSYDKVVSELKKRRKENNSLCLTGGEPTIHPRILEIVKYAKEECKYKHVRVESNGMMFCYKDFVEKLISSGVDHFQVSFHTINPKDYDRISSVKDSFSFVFKGLKNIISLGKPVSVNIVMHRYNYRNLPEIVSYIIDLGVSAIRLSSCNPFDRPKKDSAIMLRNVMPFVDKSFAVAKSHSFKPIKLGDLPPCISKKIVPVKYALVDNVPSILKSKPDKCLYCIYDKSCNGIWSAYLEIFGDSEIIPFKSLSSGSTSGMAQEYKFPQRFSQDYELFSAYFSEIVGLEEGFKNVSLFLSDKDNLYKKRSFFKNLGYCSETSGFVYMKETSFSENNPDKFKKDSLFTLYVSKDQKLCRELKEIDHNLCFHKDSSSSSFYNLYKKKSRLLGIPDCCSQFMYNASQSSKFISLLREIGDNYTVLKHLSLDKSDHLSYILNNFNSTIPQIYGFVPCSYGCSKAKRYVSIVIDYMKKERINYPLIKRGLKSPIISFLNSGCVVFDKATNKKGKIFYTLSDYFNSDSPLLSKFKKGNSFDVKREYIKIFKEEIVVAAIKKKHAFDGRFLDFSV